MKSPEWWVATLAEIGMAEKWWNSLSINQMKEHRNKHSPYSSWQDLPQQTIARIWSSEGKPASQAILPVG